MPRAKGQVSMPRLPTVPCSGDGCENRVRQTKPSISGKHYCRDVECVRQKAREAYRARVNRDVEQKLATSVAEAMNLVDFLGAAANRPRVTCQNCGLVNALPGYSHRGPAGAPCRGTGGPIPGVGVNHIDAVWPNPREYVEVSS